MPYWCAGPGFGFWWIFPLFFGSLWLLLIVSIFWRVRRFAHHGPYWARGGPEEPIAVLKGRFARGDIDHDEYERRRKVLES